MGQEGISLASKYSMEVSQAIPLILKVNGHCSNHTEKDIVMRVMTSQGWQFGSFYNLRPAEVSVRDKENLDSALEEGDDTY